ncbi:UDP-N-acetylmuramoylalanyl-D-glutamyl-2,6-diaminopimelate--D-alanyl-D-alanine ligase [Aureimonas sp. Leaf324]|jgi:UDP-N-acetylmuramoyl-tripeptide--D-alanyl-D-alanine ligase|uniref:UDP-N-acetylmuramoylalanyl-D-glutamyl-2, 6-diaminopimelate--D-alanyl-D-alanine ligase n=1 Tax=Aureimonas sp. Leaf324 TaxID=1736336 RepID=UPI0007019FD7|nr:UDP-N-acetylmuramoylalanyl-D-glutamyl-2,6-diaminopimelate--D-alanyl-D-alanine ligase [Aureimonas sp. Leaf324]KQQ86007.1 UDP-N-acetylmuramoylalanyl-D-glutamyl-2, 6-diaminopimelate--D-alanyl-D-alanine ligase [Aureimonas sp. Leaf324]
MSAPLWTGEALAAATGGRPIGAMPAAVTGVSIDTRTLQPGEAFFAIKGDAFDGHAFLRQAAAAGASMLVVAEKKLPALGAIGLPIVVVDDVLKALERLGSAARDRSAARIVAVTGSVGKTTTKDALRHVLGDQGTVHASAASFNNHWGVPLTLARLPADARFAVFEIGMNHPDEIRPLVKLVRPHVAVITLIAAAHLGFFKSLEHIAEAKAEIFEGVVPGGTAVLNADDPMTAYLIQAAQAAGVTRITTFGEEETADYRLAGFRPSASGSRIVARIDGTQVEVQLGSGGRHLVQNALAVLGAADLLGADVEQAAKSLSSWRAGKGRGERHVLPLLGGSGEWTLIDESYNANPASMRAALALLAQGAPGPSGRRIAVLGDMLELGEFSSDLHAELAGPILDAHPDLVLLCGPEMKGLDGALERLVRHEWFASPDELRESLVRHLRQGDVVMAKASKSIGFSKIVDDLIRIHTPSAEAASGMSAPSDLGQGA